MLPTEITLAQNIASSITSMTTYLILSLLIAFLIYHYRLIDGLMLPNIYKIIISFMLPVILLEFILSFIFSTLGVKLDWGSYTYTAPFLGNMIVTSGVMISRVLEMILGFGIFQNLGASYLTTFANNTQIPLTVIPVNMSTVGYIGVVTSSPFNILVYLYTNGSTVIDLIFWYVVFSAILAIVAENTTNLRLYAFGLAWIPALLYSYYFSPGYQEAMNSLEEVSYFSQYADTNSLIMFFGTLVASFVMVVLIISCVIHLVHKLKGKDIISTDFLFGGQSVPPGEYLTAVEYSLAFFVVYFSHGIGWYIFFPFMIAFDLVKKVGGSMTTGTLNDHAQRMDMKGLNASINNSDSMPEPIQSTSSGKGIGVDTILAVGLVIIVVILLINNGFIKL
jgi:hypothetical protein